VNNEEVPSSFDLGIKETQINVPEKIANKKANRTLQINKKQTGNLIFAPKTNYTFC